MAGKANIPRIPNLLAKAQLRCTGHVTRIPCMRLSKHAFFGELKASELKASTRWPQKALQGYPESLIEELWIWHEKQGNPSSGPTCLEKKSPGTCSPPWEQEKLLCYVEAVQISQGKTCGYISELYISDLSSVPQRIPGSDWSAQQSTHSQNPTKWDVTWSASTMMDERGGRGGGGGGVTTLITCVVVGSIICNTFSKAAWETWIKRGGREPTETAYV